MTIAQAVGGEGGAINTIALAEICVGEAHPESVAERIQAWGIQILSVPPDAAAPCAQAYQMYRKRRSEQSGKPAPLTPLPDFFIGAHAMVRNYSGYQK